MSVISIAHGVVILAMTFAFWRKEKSRLRKFFWPAWIVKLLGGIALGLVYTYYYTVGDTFLYFEDGVRLANLARTDLQTYFSFLVRGDDAFPVWNQLMFTEPRALFLSKITSIFCLFTADQYYIIAVYFSFFSFYGSWLLVTTLNDHWPEVGWAAALAFLFFPSVVFWTSGLIKESLAVGGLFFLTLVVVKLWERTKVSPGMWGMALLGLWLAWTLKYYYVAVYLPVVFTGLFVRRVIQPRVSGCHGLRALLTWWVVFAIPLYLISLIRPNFYPERFLEVIVNNNREFVAASEPTDLVKFEDLEPTVSSVIQNLPTALLAGIFRPFVWEANTIFQVLVSIENLVLLILLITSLKSLPNALHNPHRMLVYSTLVYVGLLCVFLTLSTPNFGTLTRYRVGFLPFFVVLIAGSNPLIRRVERFIQR